MHLRFTLFLIALLGFAASISAKAHVSRLPSNDAVAAIRDAQPLHYAAEVMAIPKRDDNTPDGSSRSSTPQGSQSNPQDDAHNAGADAPKSASDPVQGNLGSSKNGAAVMLRGNAMTFMSLVAVLAMIV